MRRSKQLPYDRILWTLVSKNGRTEWIDLRKRTKLTAAELNAVLGELEKDGKISISSRGTQGLNRAVILLRSG